MGERKVDLWSLVIGRIVSSDNEIFLCAVRVIGVSRGNDMYGLLNFFCDSGILRSKVV